MKNRKTKKGFTIVELVIVIAVIGILSAILIPTFVNLTSQAQEAAKKQQVSDAYTAYILEATDNKYDGLYIKVAEEYVAYNGAVALTQKTQADIAMNLKGEWFTYNSEKGWAPTTNNAAPSDAALVCNYFKYDSDASKRVPAAELTLYHKNGENYDKLVEFDGAPESAAEAEDGNKALSTFNGVLVYAYTHNA